MKTTAAMTAMAIERPTSRMYSTMLAPCSSSVNLAWSQLRSTNRFIGSRPRFRGLVPAACSAGHAP